MSARQEGYYWARLDDKIRPEWHIVLWCDNDGGYDGGDWWWRLAGEDDKYYDDDFSEINETRILSPDEPVVTDDMYLYLQADFANSGLPILRSNEIEITFTNKTDGAVVIKAGQIIGIDQEGKLVLPKAEA